MIKRRSLLLSGAVVTTSAASAIGAGGLLLSAPRSSAAVTTGIDPASIAKYARRMPRLPALLPHAVSPTTDYYRVTMKEAQAEVVPGFLTEVNTFDGHFPGPVLHARSGRRVVVTQTNRLGVPVSVHLHGAHVPSSSDGAPMDLIATDGGTKTYTYPNQQSHANLWFHDHAHHTESETVFRGLTATYLLRDDVETRLGLPSGRYDVPVSIRDARFDEDGQLHYEMNDFANRQVILANGRAWPYFEVAARKYRFRFYNTANLRSFALALADGSPITLIGTDGGLLAAPFQTTSVTLSPGERADVVIDFSRYPVGTELELRNVIPQPPGQPVDVAQVLQFRVTRTASDTSVVPAALRTLPPLPPATVERSFSLLMDETPPQPAYAYINGKEFDDQRIDTTITYGTTEVWTVTNANLRAPHNFHIHLVQFRVLERNGVAVTSGAESGLKDTVMLRAGETVKLQATFGGYRGVYVYHCHLFDHASMGMMAQMQVV
ncbi:Multicopper oxidase with three cupredoxin domains (includes cell division protein FtsP and spore coat protein CotA) [Actinacidiphila paucisporea]|uniref:Multicopper oxidase with three cupredoxin domains (Includes cell division protein FtsP and spore coat protein CotA) n=1 Tax=Actinacidiphila paucisporea TaxID=310782 RepID=A0A1M7NY22_9ACTN|nr:Multicopper oxidase with three cupredoxin domains (includes cell division protein FtsP and spore coat protein CotA) [Actinacidiphila paucisporea]